MKFFLTTMILLFYGSVFSQQIFSGKLTDENNFLLTSVLVINVTQNKQIYSNSVGEFSIEASKGDEIRFVKNKYERVLVKVMLDKSFENQHVTMFKLPEVIEEVKIVKLTGDLSKDSKALTKINKVDILQKELGLPQPIGKMRETPAEWKSVLFPMLLGQLDIQGIYDLISGKARRQKRQYQYDDMQEHIVWVRKRIDDDYFTNQGIPAERISEFIEFSFLTKPRTRTYVKAKNLSGVLLSLEETIPLFVKRLKKIK